MKYSFDFYTNSDYEGLVQLALNSYQWEYPVAGVSRLEFSHGLHPLFKDQRSAWRHSVGVYREGDKIVASVWNEGEMCGDVFFLFDSMERGMEKELLEDMLQFAGTQAAGVMDDYRTRFVNVAVPDWNTVLLEMVLEKGFTKDGDPERILVLPFQKKVQDVWHSNLRYEAPLHFDVKLPEGYSIVDGNESPAWYLSNVHRFAFGYGPKDRACEYGEAAFSEVRMMRTYRKRYDLCVLDPMKRPVGFCIVWYDSRMPYCELEPLGVAWWEHRKGIATALLHEASNRVLEDDPNCKGMKGGDQIFYSKIGFEEVAKCDFYHWEKKVYFSWESESADV